MYSLRRSKVKRNYVYVIRPLGAYGTRVINYAAGNCAVNTFLSRFDMWKSNGDFKLSSDNETPEVWFELSCNMYNILQQDDFIEAFKRMGVDVIFDHCDNE